MDPPLVSIMGEGKPVTMVMATKYCVIVVLYIQNGTWKLLGMLFLNE